MSPNSFPSAPSLSLPEISILEHAQEMFLRQGIRGFTVEALAADLGMSKKTLYRSFNSKEDLLRQMFELSLKRLHQEFESILNQDINPIDKFYLVVGEVLKTLSRISVARLQEIKTRYPLIWKSIESFRMARRDDFLKIFNEASAQGYIRQDLNLEQVATLFLHIANSTFQPEFFTKTAYAPVEVFHTFRELFIRGIVSPNGLKHIEEKL